MAMPELPGRKIKGKVAENRKKDKNRAREEKHNGSPTTVKKKGKKNIQKPKIHVCESESMNACVFVTKCT